MPYQNSGYQNVPTNEGQQNEEVHHSEPSQQQSYYHDPATNSVPNSSSTFLPSYHQYMYNQQGVYDNFATMGSYGPNAGELADYANRVRRNRRRIGFVVAAFILMFLLPHRAKKQLHHIDSDGITGVSPNDPVNIDITSHHSGIA
jgi:hypothetical protein